MCLELSACWNEKIIYTHTKNDNFRVLSTQIRTVNDLFTTSQFKTVHLKLYFLSELDFQLVQASREICIKSKMDRSIHVISRTTLK